ANHKHLRTDGVPARSPHEGTSRGRHRARVFAPSVDQPVAADGHVSPIGGGPRMAHQEDIALMAHLMRRAGFGAGRDELEARVAKGYEATVEELLHPETQPSVDVYTLLRYQPSALLPGGVPPMGHVNYMYYLVTTQRPLEE